MFNIRKKRNFLLCFMIIFYIDQLLNLRSYSENNKEQFKVSYIDIYKNISKKNSETFSSFPELSNKGYLFQIISNINS